MWIPTTATTGGNLGSSSLIPGPGETVRVGRMGPLYSGDGGGIVAGCPAWKTNTVTR